MQNKHTGNSCVDLNSQSEKKIIFLSSMISGKGDFSILTGGPSQSLKTHQHPKGHCHIEKLQVMVGVDDASGYHLLLGYSPLHPSSHQQGCIEHPLCSWLSAWRCGSERHKVLLSWSLWSTECVCACACVCVCVLRGVERETQQTSLLTLANVWQ